MISPTWKSHVLPDIKSLQGKRILIRVDLNLPESNGKILDTTRLDILLPFLRQFSFVGAKVILLSHFGEEGKSIGPVAELLTQKLQGVSFVPTTNIDEIRNKIAEMPLGSMLLLENSRMFPGEEDNTPSCAQAFASLADVFVNDAFSVSHRNHASVTGVPKYILSYLGPTCTREVEHLLLALTPKPPALLIVGGAKIKTKLTLIQRYLDLGVHVFVGGAMVHNSLKQRGYEIGDSLYDPTYTVLDSVCNHPLLITPTDVILETGKEVTLENIAKGDVIVDCGKKTLATLDTHIQKAGTVIMNGPLGLYEKGWMNGTEHLLTTLGEAKTVHTYLGGGDTVAVAASIHALSKIYFVSLGGGAMLDFLASGTLPGIDAVTESKVNG